MKKIISNLIRSLKAFSIGKLFSYIIFISWLLITLVPLIWMMYSSFKTTDEINRNTYSFPKDLFSNYNDEFTVIAPQLNIVYDYDVENDKRPRIIIESATVTPGRRVLVFFLLKEELPAELQNLKDGDTVFVNQLPFSMRFEINWKTMLFNYRSCIRLGGLVFKFFNSLIYAGVSTFFIVVFGLMIGYAISKMKFKKLSRIVMMVIGAGYLVSINSVIIPLFLMMSSLHLTDTHLGIILVYTAFGIPLAVMLSSQYISGLPDSLIESAYMDGATPMKTFFKIIVPICTPVIITISIISALGIWNEFLLVLILGGSEFTKSLPVGVYSFSSLTSQQLGWQLAALVVGTAPAMVIYFSFNKYLTQGVVAGSVKE